MTELLDQKLVDRSQLKSMFTRLEYR